MTTPTLHTFPSFPKPTKVGGLDLHNHGIIAHTLALNLDHVVKVYANFESFLATVEK